MHLTPRFTITFLETLDKDEEALLYYIYHHETKRIIDFRCVKVLPVYEMMLRQQSLTEKGMNVLAGLFLKVATEYGLPTHGLTGNMVAEEPLFKDDIPEDANITLEQLMEDNS